MLIKQLNLRTFLVACAFFAATASLAQTAQGSLVVGGELQFFSSSYEVNSDIKQSGILFNPSAGYFIQDNLAVGLALRIGSNTNDNGATKTVENTFGLGPVVRYYKFTSNEDFAFFGQAVLFFNSEKEDMTPGGETKGSEISFDVSPGFAWFFTDHWSVEFSVPLLRYISRDPNKDADNDKVNSFIFNVSSLNPSLGFRYYLGN